MRIATGRRNGGHQPGHRKKRFMLPVLRPYESDVDLAIERQTYRKGDENARSRTSPVAEKFAPPANQQSLAFRRLHSAMDIDISREFKNRAGGGENPAFSSLTRQPKCRNRDVTACAKTRSLRSPVAISDLMPDA